MDFMKMMGNLKDMQAKLKEAQENLVHVTATGEAGAGMVTAEVNGLRQVVRLEIDDSLVKAEDKEIMQDLIVAAINKGMEDVEVKSKEELKKSTEGLIPNIPGMNFGV
jgi:DNA-binding YbaB/EbfC family protein